MKETVLLERKLQEMFDLLNISPAPRVSLNAYCSLLKLKDEATYCHCLRVALYGVKIAELLRLDIKAMFYSGLLHDIGKIMIDREILTNKTDFNEADYEKIKEHPLFGYRLLRDIHKFSAEIIVRHHRHTKGYPETLPVSKVSYSAEDKALIEYYSEILAIIDFYDSAATRGNKKGKILGQGEILDALVRRFPLEEEAIRLCYEKGIFGGI